MPALNIKALKAARKRIKAGWTQDAFARREDGTETGWLNGDAVCFCLSGAIRASGLFFASPEYTAVTDACGGSIPSFNDAPGRKKREIVAILDKVIKDHS